MKVFLSPLRYPGSKRRLVPYVRATLSKNGLQPSLFVEPFAGGASVAIQLLGEGAVERIGIADKDPLVAAFWKLVFFDADWLIRRINTAAVTTRVWKRMRAIAQQPRDYDDRERGFACLFLNRTSFSGILNGCAGPLGGHKQRTAYRIDCRFPKRTLVRRIERLATLSDRVEFVWNTSWKATIAKLNQLRERGRVPFEPFYYFDPPFFEKAERLYNCFFTESEHQELAKALHELKGAWLLSYDHAPQVWQYYGSNGFRTATIKLLYNTPGSGNHDITKEIIISSVPALPRRVSLWRLSK